MPVWVTINEATDIINRYTDNNIKGSDLWRYALYGLFPLSIFFQSQIKLKKVCFNGDNILFSDTGNSSIDKITQLSDISILNEENKIIKTEGDLISPEHHIIDTPLLGHEYITLQRLLAHSLNIPKPITGQYNFHHGVFARENDITYQVFEATTLEKIIEQRLRHLPASIVNYYNEKLKHIEIEQKGIHYFPLHHFPDDAWFVIKRSALEQFISVFFPHSKNNISKIPTRISTPLSRFLWLACRNNKDISSLLGQPYKLLSIFEKWAESEGITEKLNGDTLKTALERGSPTATPVSS